ncbi:unnamed protein product, partial [Candidula unifasciata]
MKVASKSGPNIIDEEIGEVQFEIVIDDDEDDDILIQAEDASFGEQTEEKEKETEIDLTGIDFDEEMEVEEAANISVGVSNTIGDSHDSGGSGFDLSTGNLWIYPTNYPVRDYQYNIVQQALYKNTLVVLPTGLGKTFIAAVLMYNFFRWFPQGKIVFMAPTKPLVAQQILACYNIMGIPKEDTVEMTGTMSPTLRQKAWREKRVVFLTPQVMTNDLSRGSVTAESIKCLVLDEAHKALGNHAYCQVVRELIKFTREFRVLALSATPGSDLKAVQQMMTNLLISHIELRSEESIDIKAYTHERRIDKIVIPMGEELSGLRLIYIRVMTCVVQRLIRNGVLYNREATKLSKFLLLKARDEFRQNPPQNLQQAHYGNIEADFAMAISLYHGFELLQLHGLRSLYNYLTGIIVGEKGYGRTRSELLRNADFNDIMENLRQKFTGASSHGVSSESGDGKVVVGHPKMQRLEEIVVDHFKTFEKKGDATRVMIFSQYRDSVQEIASILNQHQPLIKVMPFIGQSSAGKTTKGYTQKEQLMVMQQFREGGYNTLVSTCVGEEGLDIGDVDLIVCFDAHKSPIRLVQRMGRTGRKRQGRIVMLVTEGKEEQIYNQSLYSKKTIHKAILNAAKSLHFYPDNPRMLPSSVTPQCHKMHITLAAEIKKTKTPGKNKRLLSSKNKTVLINKNKTISDVFSKQVKRVFEDECLTAEEYDDIKKEFSELQSAGKQLSKPRCVMLESGIQTNSSRLIDFSEWMPWQNRLQTTHMIGHSVQTVNLVKTSEFMELQRCIGDDEDHYGLEMNRWLKDNATESRIQYSEGQSSMHSFLTNTQDKSNTFRKDKLHQDVTDAILVESDSSMDGGHERTSATEHVKPKVSKLFTELGSSNDTSNLQSSNGSKNKSNRRRKAGSNKIKRLGTKSAVQKKVEPVKKKKLSGIYHAMTAKIRKTSFLKLLETSSCDIPSTKDSDDFEVDRFRDRRSWQDTDNEKIACSDSKAHKDSEAHEDSKAHKDSEAHEDSKAHEDSETHKDNVVDNNNVTLNTHVELDVSMSDDLEKGYPIPHAIEKNGKVEVEEMSEFPTDMSSGSQTCTDSLARVTFSIPKPPPVSGVKEMFQSLKSGKEFRELDLEELMEQWNEFGRDVCSMTASLQNVFMSVEKRSGLQSVTTSHNARKPDLSLCPGGHFEAVSPKMKKKNHVTPKTNVAKLFIQEKQLVDSTISDTCNSADNIAEENLSKSPVFKHLVNKTVHTGKSALDKQSHFSEKWFASEDKQQTDFCKAEAKTPRFNEVLFKTSAQETKTAIKSGVKSWMQETDAVQHVSSSKDVMNTDIFEKVIDKDIPKEIMKTDIFNKDNCDILMTSLVDGEEIGMNSCKNTPVSPVSLHESFVTFTQAMECLQTSSEENLSTPPPCKSSTRSMVFSEQPNFHKNILSSGNTKSKIESADSGHHNLRTCDQYNEHAPQKFVDTAVPCTTSFSINSSTGFSVNATEASVQDSLVRNLQSDNDSERIGLKSKNQSSSHLTETPVGGCSSNSKPDLPQFDLGFDFDDDDDIIPPTPTKYLSQDSVFGLKTFTIDKPLLQESRMLSSSDTDQAAGSVRRLTRDLPVASPPASALSNGTGDFEPFLSTFDLQLSSDDSQELPRKIFTKDTTSNPEADIGKEQRVQHSSNQWEPGSDGFHQNNMMISSEDEGSFHILPLVAEREDNKVTSLKLSLPFPPKKKKLPLDELGSAYETEQMTVVGDFTSSSEDRPYSDKTRPRNSTMSKARLFRLGKRHIQEAVCANTVVSGNKEEELQKPENLETTLQAPYNLNNFDEIDDYNEDIFKNSDFDQMETVAVSRSNNPISPAPACQTPETTAVLSHVQESPEVHEKSAHQLFVTASTPIRDTAKCPAIHSAIDDTKEINMFELTPIRAKIDESKLDSDAGFVFRRKKHIKALDISSDGVKPYQRMKGCQSMKKTASVWAVTRKVSMLDISLSNLNSMKPPSLLTREERLRRQKEKQE